MINQRICFRIVIPNKHINGPSSDNVVLVAYIALMKYGLTVTKHFINHQRTQEINLAPWTIFYNVLKKSKPLQRIRCSCLKHGFKWVRKLRYNVEKLLEAF